MIAENNTENPQEEQKLVHDTENPALTTNDKETKGLTEDSSEECSHMNCVSSVLILLMSIFFIAGASLWKDGQVGTDAHNDALGTMYLIASILYTTHVGVEVLKKKDLGCVHMLMTSFGFLAGFVWFVGACVLLSADSFGDFPNFPDTIPDDLVPDIPDVPNDPGFPNFPDIPDDPDFPDFPDDPDFPDFPDDPDFPGGFGNRALTWYDISFNGSNEFNGFYACWLLGSLLNLVYIIYEGVKISENFTAKKKIYQLLALIFVFMANLFILAASSVFLQEGLEGFAFGEGGTKSASDLMVTASVFYLFYGVLISLHYFL